MSPKKHSLHHLNFFLNYLTVVIRPSCFVSPLSGFVSPLSCFVSPLSCFVSELSFFVSPLSCRPEFHVSFLHFHVRIIYHNLHLHADLVELATVRALVLQVPSQ